MTAAPTAEQYLAERDLEDDLPPYDEPLPGDSLASIADSLRRVTTILERRDVEDRGDSELQADYDQLLKEYDEVERLHDRKQALIEQVLEICKPSTSKLAIAIRAALEPPVVPVTDDPSVTEPADDPDDGEPS